jgi:hypothetical protein
MFSLFFLYYGKMYISFITVTKFSYFHSTEWIYNRILKKNVTYFLITIASYNIKAIHQRCAFWVIINMKLVYSVQTRQFFAQN